MKLVDRERAMAIHDDDTSNEQQQMLPPLITDEEFQKVPLATIGAGYTSEYSGSSLADKINQFKDQMTSGDLMRKYLASFSFWQLPMKIWICLLLTRALINMVCFVIHLGKADWKLTSIRLPGSSLG